MCIGTSGLAHNNIVVHDNPKLVEIILKKH
jgi:hypothetical protein